MKTSKNISAFMLIELIIASLILGLGLIFVFEIFPLSMQTITYSKRVNEAAFFAAKKIDEIKAQGLNDGPDCGKEGNIEWKINLRPVDFGQGLTLNQAELDISYQINSNKEKHRFIIILAPDQ
jgi:hypothetical protein